MFVFPFSSAFHTIPGSNNFILLTILPETMNMSSPGDNIGQHCGRQVDDAVLPPPVALVPFLVGGTFWKPLSILSHTLKIPLQYLVFCA